MMANPETVAEVDTSLGKIIFLSLVSILLAALSGYLLLAAFQNGEARSYFWAIITLCLFLAAFVLHTLLIKYFQTQVLIIILESAALTAFFLQPFIKFLSIVTLTLWSVGMLFLIWGAYAGYQYLQSNLKIKFFQLATRTLRGASTGLAIILVILYIAFYGTQGIPLSQGTVQLFLRTMQPFAQRYVASFSLDLTINDLFREIII
ncbi:MAG: hypothetical protein HY456_00355, partial [Parcubacteria group bacterium]|nr:hypothetical protein [Parcubacteria group bacterium]